MVNKTKEQAQIKLSMIVPVYGVEAYIHRFLDSLSGNLHDALEVIFVDDGSKDSCGDILDAYQAQHSQVRVIHQENGGVSSARNTGLVAATGDYILFADPDDYLAEGYTEIVLDAIEMYHQPDMILFDHYRKKRERWQCRKGADLEEGMLTAEELLHGLAQDYRIRSYLVNKITKRSVCKGCWFDESLRYCEDVKWLTEVSLAVKSVAYRKKGIYYYDERAGSLSKTVSHTEIKKTVQIFLDRCEKYRAVLGEVSLCAPIKFMIMFCRMKYQGLHDEDILFYEEFIYANIGPVLWEKGLSIHQKIRGVVIALGLGKYCYRKK